MWDDTGASNAEFAEAVRIFSLKDVTFLEVRFLNPDSNPIALLLYLTLTCFNPNPNSNPIHFPLTLEARFLGLIDYNVNVSRQLYTTCYFELRDLCEGRHDPYPVRPASVYELRDPGRQDFGERSSRSGAACAPTRARAKSVHISGSASGAHDSLPLPPAAHGHDHAYLQVLTNA